MPMPYTPKVSVLMSTYNDAAHLPASIDSVLEQTEKNFEVIIVNDGSTDPAVAHILAEYVKRHERIKAISKPNEGLTRALMEGCRAARGQYVARGDVGGVMLPTRLQRQAAVLGHPPDAVLAPCWAELFGPAWEPLYLVRNVVPGAGRNGDWVASFHEDGEERNRLLGPTHHGSVMFRTTAYRQAGGYRWQFYYGQDWDLWYRLAERGKFAGVQAMLYRCRIFPEGISMQNAERQQQIHACSRGAFLARARGEDETAFLEEAARVGGFRADLRLLRPAGSSAPGNYFIGETLRRNGDIRCRHYLWRAVATRPWMGTGWLRLAQGMFARRFPARPLPDSGPAHLVIIAPNCCQGSVGAVAWRHAVELSRWFQVHVLSEAIPQPPNERIHAVRLAPPHWNYLRRFCHVPNALSFERAARCGLDALCRQTPIGTVWCHGHASVILAAASLRRRHRFRIVMTPLDDLGDRPAGTYSRELTWYYRMLTGPAYRRADAVQAISPYMADLARSGGAREVQIIPHGIDLADIGLQELPRRTADSYCPDGIIRLLYVGSLLPIKGVEVLLAAVSQLTAGALEQGRSLQVRLCLAGGGKEQPRYEQLAADLGLGKIVRFAGALERTQLGPLYVSSDALCVPSLSEALSLAGLEGMICGLPIIGSRTGGLGYIVAEAETGRLSAPGDVGGLVESILHICQSRERLASLGQAAQRRAVTHFTWPSISEQLRGLVSPKRFT